MEPHIDKLYAELYAAEDVARKLRKAIAALQDICDHDLEYEGHGHNDSYYTCAKCGYRKSQ